MTSTAGSTCPIRLITLLVPDSGAQQVKMAPRLAAAYRVIIASGMLGRYAATRSPGPTPRPCSAARSDATRARSSPRVSSIRGRVSERATRTVASGGPARACSAKLSVAPGNHSAPGILASVSTAAGWSWNRTPRYSASEPQNPARSATDQRHRAW